MSGDRRNSRASTNGFPPPSPFRTLLKKEATAMHDNNYPALPNMRVPHGWALSINDIPMPIPAAPTNRELRAAVTRHYWDTLTSE